MQFQQTSNAAVWRTEEGEIRPQVDAVVYDLDDLDDFYTEDEDSGNGYFVCTFTVDRPLTSFFREKISPIEFDTSRYSAYI
jgi:hypothetical protein